MTGRVPDWYWLIRAARYLGVPPWDLSNQPAIWVSWALAAEVQDRRAGQRPEA